MCNEKLFFMMSKRFNKKKPEDFSLILAENTDAAYILPVDHSLWRERHLYDFGWGKENGYYRLPLPKFDELVSILLSSELDENRYGAAAILLDDYPEQLLIRCEEIIADTNVLKKNVDFFKILQLEKPINRSLIIGKDNNEIQNDFEKWVSISRKIRKVKE